MWETLPVLSGVGVFLMTGLMQATPDGEVWLSTPEQALPFYTSPWTLGPLFLMLFGVWYGNSSTSSMTQVERFVVYWHLSNGAYWSLGCDVMSGLLQVTPRMAEIYQNVLDTKHKDPVARTSLDAVYWTEATLHIPISLVCFYLAIKRHPSQAVLESFLFGAQFVGTIAYYLPELLTPGQPNWPPYGLIRWLGVYFGLVWMVVPALLLVRNVRLASSAASKKEDSKRKKR